MNDYTLTTERCHLRRLSCEDSPHVWSAAHTPGFTDGMTWEPPANEEEIHVFTEKALRDWEAGERFVWTIEDAIQKTFIGRIEICRDRKLHGSTWGLGYWIHPSQQGKGYATEAGKAVIRFAFEALQADSIVSSHHDWNEASGNVLRKIGMHPNGEVIGRTIKNGMPVRSIEFWLDRKDWIEQ